MDEMRFRTQQSPRNESSLNSFVSPPRNGGTRLPQPVSSHDPRSTLPRRFTTDSGRVPTLSTITTQRGPEPQDLAATTALHKVQLLEKKRLEYEKLREQKRRFEAEMQKLDQQQRREEQELVAMQEDLGRMGANSLAGHQSEPTTPPEYRETSSGFPTMFSRPNRYSTSSLTSPPGLFNRPARSGSQLASPQSGIVQSRFAFDDQLPSRSVPGSRRNSDEDEKEEAVRQDPTSHRSTNATNRYSMPVTRSRTGFYDLNLDQTNTTRFLFGEDEENTYQANKNTNGMDDNFPTLTRREGQPNMGFTMHIDPLPSVSSTVLKLSASSAALDLANSQSPEPDTTTSNGWGSVNRHRTQQSISAINASQLNGNASVAPGQTSSASDVPSIGGGLSSTIRHSFDMKYFPDNSSDLSGSIMTTPTNPVLATPPKLQTSFSANDVPTVKNSSGVSGMATNANNHAQQYLHNHNASLGRIPAGAMPHRHSRELSSGGDNNAVNRDYASIGSALQANATPFGPMSTQAPVSAPSNAPVAAPQPANPYAGYYGGANYNMPTTSAPAPYPTNIPLLSQGMQGLSLNGSSVYSPQNFTGFGAVYGTPSQIRDSQARVIQNRRQMDNEAMNRFNNMPLESVGGTIYELCKDQHGCRYLQKQLENRIPEQVHMIWLETNQHVVELMTDPFGNYLCQKLLEYCNDEERTVLIQNASQDMVRIALNQHGTRALQKMIEFVSTDGQVQTIIEALRHRVVELIQDLNGNHVIQKCLNKLSAADAQFIFDAVGGACVEVGTHRHGCCVLQRCIDHASGDQKLWLIQRITDHAVTLIQDPFGNYVVQYIIDLNESTFTEPLVAQFRGRICQLSRHKFSSNVVEKCLRCALDPSKDMIVDELLAPAEMERLLRDSFANYVIQTALEYATPYMKIRMVDAIRPILPQVRSTPYGRRIQAKIQAFDSRSGQSSGQITPSDNTQGQIPLRPGHSRAMSSNTSILAPGGGFANGANGLNNGANGLTNGLNGLGGARGSQQPNYPASSVLTVPPPQAPRPAAQYGAPAAFTRPGLPSNGVSSPGAGGAGSVGNPAGAGTAAGPSENGEPSWL